MANGTILTKQAVADRLILSAVRLIAQDHDPIAVHCVAASATSLLRELVAGRGQNYGSRTFAAALFENALAQVENRKPLGTLPSDPTVDAAILTVRSGIESGAILSPEDIDVAMPKSVESQALSGVISPFNFMKHADRDPNGFLEETELQPIEATVHAVTAYSFLFPAAPLSQEVRDFLDAHVL